jgi:VanZ family protein
MLFEKSILKRIVGGRMIFLMGPWAQKICRASAWLLALAIVVLSLVPPFYRPITEASHNVEHLAIFLATGFTFCVAYPDRPCALAIGLVIFCGAIELAQRWVPGRHARLSDFIVDAAAACIGLGVTSAAMRFSG